MCLRHESAELLSVCFPARGNLGSLRVPIDSPSLEPTALQRCSKPLHSGVCSCVCLFLRGGGILRRDSW
jgi:hypothetical protein